MLLWQLCKNILQKNDGKGGGSFGGEGGSGGGSDNGGINPPTNISVNSITVTVENETVERGSTLQFGRTITPNNATNKTIVWSVETLNWGTVTINSSGLLKATGVGTIRVIIYLDIL